MLTAAGQGSAELPLIHMRHFIQSVREIGYRDTVWAVAELIDNALESGATTIRVVIRAKGRLDEPEAFVAVIDNGRGMVPGALQASVQFGGSSRYGSRDGLGRFGMGLPCSSLSRSKQLGVYSWQRPGEFYSCVLDLDEVAAGRQTNVPVPARAVLPPELLQFCGPTGTIVQWRRCDRLGVTRPAVLRRHLMRDLGKIFRHYLTQKVRLFINDEAVRPVDPLYLEPSAANTGATAYGDALLFNIAIPDSKRKAVVRVRFSELPIEKWHAVPNEQKRALGVAKGAGISVVRGGREIDYGWCFMPNKRRENYDDWWRCEVSFEPELDEMFGVTTTKQGIRPTPELVSILSPEIEATARKLNMRVRQKFESLRVRAKPSSAEAKAERSESILEPMPDSYGRPHRAQIDRLMSATEKKYSVVESASGEPSFFQPIVRNGRLSVVINSEHPFYRRVLAPLYKGNQAATDLLHLMLIAAARAESTSSTKGAKDFRVKWSNVLAAFLDR